MRITNRTLVRTFLNNLNTNRDNMRKYQDQMSSGKEIRRPSDDPFAVVRAMELNDSIKKNEQYLRNIEDSIGWLDTTDMALGQIGDSLGRIRELITAAANGTNTQTELDAYKAEILQRIEEISQSGNTAFDGRYIFSGNKTTTSPFATKANGELSFIGDAGKLNREISPNVIVSINVSGNEIMNGKDVYGNSLNMNATLQGIVNALSQGKNSELGGKYLKEIQDNVDNVLRLRAEVGAKANRMETAMAKNGEETFNMTEILAKTEDIDIAQKMMEYKVMETVYQASLMAGAKVIQPSLIDFLR